MEVLLNLNDPNDYEKFLLLKRIPRVRFTGRSATFPDEYAHLLGNHKLAVTNGRTYKSIAGLFDYQGGVATLAIRKKKFAAFMECGMGKTLVMLEFARHVRKMLPRKKRILIVSPLMVIPQTLGEVMRFYGKLLPIHQVEAKNLKDWLRGDHLASEWIGITNYEAVKDDLEQGELGALILDESSMLKSHYGKWGSVLIRLGRGLEWKLALTGTPAPNDRIEYANHGVFLDAYPTVNSFLARYFINRGQTQNRWELKSHALEAFYRDLSDWSIFLTSPATYGWKDNCDNIPPVHVHIHDLDLTAGQREAVYDLTGKLFMDAPGGIVTRSKLARIGKGSYNGNAVATVKPAFIRELVDSWTPEESTLIWCWHNDEQKTLEKVFPEAASIKGETPYADRKRLIQDFQTGKTKVLISKPKVLGYGLNLHVATRQVFSSLIDSYESYYQAVKRSNRYGSTRPLNVHLPVTEIERPMVENVIRKAARVHQDTLEQERVFKEHGYTIHG